MRDLAQKLESHTERVRIDRSGQGPGQLRGGSEREVTLGVHVYESCNKGREGIRTGLTGIPLK